VLAAAVGVPVEIEEGRFRRRTEQRLQVFPIEARIDVDVVGLELEDFRSILTPPPTKFGSVIRFPLHPLLSSPV
jgi:hypothetical protein